jgi:hypothetical protein
MTTLYPMARLGAPLSEISVALMRNGDGIRSRAKARELRLRVHGWPALGRP